MTDAEAEQPRPVARQGGYDPIGPAGPVDDDGQGAALLAVLAALGELDDDDRGRRVLAVLYDLDRLDETLEVLPDDEADEARRVLRLLGVVDAIEQAGAGGTDSAPGGP